MAKHHSRLPIAPGQEFDRWTVLSIAPSDKRKQKRWFCRCKCGTIRDVAASHLRRGTSRSCGCLIKELASKRATTHGMTKTPEHRIWRTMKNRILNPRNKDYPRYGGRGLKISEEFAHSFLTWLEEVGPRPSPKYSIGRIDNSRGYESGNVRWETAPEQASNRRTNRFLVYEERKQTLSQWSKEKNLSIQLIRSRLKRGWSVADTLSISPVGYFRKNPTIPSPQ